MNVTKALLSQDGRSVEVRFDDGAVRGYSYPLPDAVNRGGNYLKEAKEWLKDNTPTPWTPDVEALVRQVWEERYAIANDPMTGLDFGGAAIVEKAADAGNAKALEIKAWLYALYAEAVEREAAIRRGEDPGDWTTPKEKPHSVQSVGVSE
jgi:hypothetical protein